MAVPCPFCGGQPEIYKTCHLTILGTKGWCVQHTCPAPQKFKISGGLYLSEADAIWHWNGRKKK